MNGVRRFLGGGAVSTSTSPTSSNTGLPASPLSVSGKPSWPPQSPTSPTQPPFDSLQMVSTPGLFIRKDRQRQALVSSPTGEEDASAGTEAVANQSHHFPRSGSNASSVASPTRSQPVAFQDISPARKSTLDRSSSMASSSASGPSRIPSNGASKLQKSINSEYKRLSGVLNTRDDLLISLLTSEAVVDSRDAEILSSEEVEELKKEDHVLSIRIAAAKKKLNLETKMRNAALSLSKVNAANKTVSPQTEDQLEASERKVQSAQRELLRTLERASEVQRKLLEHRAAVLSLSVRNMEKKMTVSASSSTNGTNTDEGLSGFNTPSRHSQTDSLTSSAATSVSPSSKVSHRFDGAHLFAGHANAVIPQVPRAPVSLADVASLEQKLKDATDALLEANKKQAELARELMHARLEKEELATTMGMELQNAEETICSLEIAQPRLAEVDLQLNILVAERGKWEEDKRQLDERNAEVEKLERRLVELEENSADAVETDRMLEQIRESNNIELQRRDDELSRLKEEWAVSRARMEDDLRLQAERVDTMTREIDGIRLEREQAMKQVNALGQRLKDASSSGVANGITSSESNAAGDAAQIISLLQPLWAVLPSPEARASKLGAAYQRHFRTASPTSSPLAPGSPKPIPASLSDMDVRSLKTLFDSRSNSSSAANSPDLNNGFTIEAFAARVEALIADDRALIERLIRFAQAHDLLKKNAERAQKLAQESNAALETYQKQVKALEDRNMSATSRHVEFMEEIQRLQDSVSLVLKQKREIEQRATAQAEVCRQLTEANKSLSARALTLAEEAALAPEALRKQLDECRKQFDECRGALQKAQEDLVVMRESGQTQRIALMDELNSAQTENGNLRAQLRAVKK